MSAFREKADIFVFLSAISLRQCRSARWWIAEPTVLPRSEYRKRCPDPLLDELQNIIRRYAGRDFGKGRSLLGATGRHSQKYPKHGNQVNGPKKMRPASPPGAKSNNAISKATIPMRPKTTMKLSIMILPRQMTKRDRKVRGYAVPSFRFQLASGARPLDCETLMRPNAIRPAPLRSHRRRIGP